jgi:Ca2+-binding RTX toxin-like protein
MRFASTLADAAAEPSYDASEAETVGAKSFTDIGLDITDVSSDGMESAAVKDSSDVSLDITNFSPDRTQSFDIYGTSGSDVIDLTTANPGSEWYFNVHAGAGQDYLLGSLYGDILQGEDGDDSLSGLEGDDTLIGGAGDDRLYGGLGNDLLIGGSGNSQQDGGDGNDTLQGGSLSDELNGGAGDDVLNGGGGPDFLFGGEGADRFVISERDGFSPELITDFSPDQGDKIDLVKLLNEHTNFTGTTAAEAFSQGYIYFVQYGTPGPWGASDSDYFHTNVCIDTDGGAHGPGTSTDFVAVSLDNVAASQLTSLPFLV